VSDYGVFESVSSSADEGRIAKQVAAMTRVIDERRAEQGRRRPRNEHAVLQLNPLTPLNRLGVGVDQWPTESESDHA
jgi:hypothetical protein